jgi:hypothetical protein
LGYWHAARLAAAILIFQEERLREPKDLSELAPEYLAEIPRCPYGGQPCVFSEGRLESESMGLSLSLRRL